MTGRQAAAVWRELDQRSELSIVARRLEKGPLQGQHVIEVESRPPLEHKDFTWLSEIAVKHNLELSFGKSPRRVLVLS